MSNCPELWTTDRASAADHEYLLAKGIIRNAPGTSLEVSNAIMEASIFSDAPAILMIPEPTRSSLFPKTRVWCTASLPWDGGI